MPRTLPKRECLRKYDLSMADIKKMSDEEKEEFLRSSRNYEGSSGWRPLEAALFRLALTKYGCGNWDTCSYFLPHHNTAQFNTFAQKLFGQQSLAPFSGLKLDPYEAYLRNSEKHQLRKNGVVVHEGAPLTSQAKRELKEEWKKKEHAMDFELPIVEDRARNYTKLLTQMMEMESRVIDEEKRRGVSEDVNWKFSDDGVIFEDWMTEMNLDNDFHQLTDWDRDTELNALKGQDNLWPLIRFVEDPEWYEADQFLCLNWVSGRCALDLPEFGASGEDGYLDVFIPETAEIQEGDRKQRKTNVNESKEEDMAVDDDDNDDMAGEENEPEMLELDEESNVPPEKPFSKWTCKEFCDYLVSKQVSAKIIEGCRRYEINGKNCINKTEEVLTEIGVFDNKEMESSWCTTVMAAMMKYKYNAS